MKKFLLVALNTTREVEGKRRKVRLGARTVQDLNAEEIDLLDRLTKRTGKLHYRDPVNEDAAVAGPETTGGPAEGFNADDATVAQLKDYLDENSVEYDADAKKADLQAAVKQHQADGGL
jgi:hypothetical protein